MNGLKSDKLYRRVIDAVLADIHGGRHPIGARLPAERELAEAHGVSRTTVREAMVALEMLGIVEMRKGSGIFVIGAGSTEAVAVDLDIGAFELMEARRLIESDVAALAALYADDDHIARLEMLLEEMTHPEESVAELADREFHLVVAQATGNGAMLSVVTHLWEMRERAPLARSILHRARGMGLHSRIAEHRAVVDAIRARDADAAKAAMKGHLDRVIDHLLVMTENDDITAARARNANLRKRARLSFA